VRTTIELDSRRRAILLKLAAERGEKGFSRLIAEAIDLYIANLGSDDRQVALKLRGVLSTADATELEDRTKAIRESWR
jgi:DNA integrity scanning protein DisA with diadenylate cyclase activity